MHPYWPALHHGGDMVPLLLLRQCDDSHIRQLEGQTDAQGSSYLAKYRCELDQ